MRIRIPREGVLRHLPTLALVATVFAGPASADDVPERIEQSHAADVCEATTRGLSAGDDYQFVVLEFRDLENARTQVIAQLFPQNGSRGALIGCVFDTEKLISISALERPDHGFPFNNLLWFGGGVLTGLGAASAFGILHVLWHRRPIYARTASVVATHSNDGTTRLDA